MKIIFDTISGTLTEGVVAVDGSFRRQAIYVDNPENLLGFRRYLKTYFSEKLNAEFIEIGYFMEMLYEGSIEAFQLLKTNKEFHYGKTLEFDLLVKDEEFLVSYNLVNNLLKSSSDLLGEMKKNKKSIKINGQKFEYNVNKAYICLRNLNLAISVLQFGKFDMEKIDTVFLQSVLDNKFDLERIEKTHEELVEKIEELEESSDLRLIPSLDHFNSLLGKIRNVKVTNLDYEE